MDRLGFREFTILSGQKDVCHASSLDRSIARHYYTNTSTGYGIGSWLARNQIPLYCQYLSIDCRDGASYAVAETIHHDGL